MIDFDLAVEAAAKEEREESWLPLDFDPDVEDVIALNFNPTFDKPEEDAMVLNFDPTFDKPKEGPAKDME